MRLKPIERSNAYESVRDRLLAAIERGEIEPGSKLPSESELATAFRVSRPVVREALGSLRAMGLVRSETGRGSFLVSTASELGTVRLKGRYTCSELHEVRMLVEVASSGFAAKRRTDDQLSEIEAATARFGTCTNAIEYAECDIAFHMALGRASGNRIVELLLKDLQELVREETVLLATDNWQANWGDDHRKIFQAILCRDERAARRLMVLHLRKVHHQLLTRIAVGLSKTSHSIEYRPQSKPMSWLDTEANLARDRGHTFDDSDLPGSA